MNETTNNKLTNNLKINIDKSFLLTSIPNQIIPRYSKRIGKTYDNEQEQGVHDKSYLRVLIFNTISLASSESCHIPKRAANGDDTLLQI